MSNAQETNNSSSRSIVIIDDDLECGSDAFYSTFEEEEEEEEEDEIERLSDCSVTIILSSYVDVHVDANADNGKVKDCRICHLTLINDDDDDADDAIELGCCCKNDLAAAHKHCAQTWFKIKGNKICEICNSIASNLLVPNEMPSVHGSMDVNSEATMTHISSSSGGGGGGERGGRVGVRGGGCINGHRLLNFILACLVFAFVISWLFHFNIPS